MHSKSVGLVAQLDRVPDYGSGGCGFDSRPVHEKEISESWFPFFCLLKYTKNTDRLYSILHEKDAKNNPPKRERLILESANHNLFQTPFQFDILHLRLGLAYMADISECMALE